MSKKYLLFLSIAFTVILLEAIFRIGGFLEYQRIQRLLESGNLHVKPITDNRKVDLKDIIQISANPKLIYELIPNTEGLFINQPIKINPKGFRGAEVDVKKSDNVIRIVGLGDSVMFGWGVAESKNFLERLNINLSQKFSNHKWEIINLAVPGYNTAMEVEAFKEKGLKYKPDIVVLNFVANDLDLPNFIKKEPNYFSFHQSFLWEFIELNLKHIQDRDNTFLKEAPQVKNKRYRKFESEPDKVPKMYREMVGIAGFQNALNELKQLSDEFDFILYVTAYSYAPEYLQKICLELNVPLIKLMDHQLVEEYIDAGKKLRLKNDVHPSTDGHEIMSKVLLRAMLEDNQFKELISKND